MAMRWSYLALALTLATCGEGIVLRGRTASLEAEASGDWAALSEAESEDRSFLLSQLDETESELVKLQQFIEVTGQTTGALAGLQISATPVDKKAKVEVKPAVAKKEVAKPAAKPVAAKEVAKPAAKPVAKAVAKPAAKDEDPTKVLKSLGIPSLGKMSKGLQGTAALIPMLAMLKGLYEDSKDRISQQNVREAKSKKWFAEKEVEHKAKIASIEGKFKNHTLSEEFRTNETRDETRYFTYWQRCRERQHRQFHTNLKIQHAMMMKVKKMIDMYEKTLSTKDSDKKAAKKELGQMTGMPEIVFLQDVQRTVGSFCRESLAEVRKEKAELQQNAKEGLPY